MSYIHKEMALSRLSDALSLSIDELTRIIGDVPERDSEEEMRKHKYLNDIGIANDDICVPLTSAQDDDRLAKFMKEREEYGFDSRETWGLSFTSAMWLYEHLSMYLDVVSEIINLDYHKFTASKIQIEEGIWEASECAEIPNQVSVAPEETLTQKQWIEICCKYLKEYINSDKNQDEAEKAHPNCRLASIIQEYIDTQKGIRAFAIYAAILPAMWW